MVLLAKDIMNREVVCVYVHNDVRELARLLVEKHISGVPVLDERDNLVGVVSQTDVLHYHLSTGQEVISESDFYKRPFHDEISFRKGFHVEDFNVATVQEIMTPVLFTATEETPVSELAALMYEKKIHRVLITKDQKLRGIVTTMDLIKLLIVEGKEETK